MLQEILLCLAGHPSPLLRQSKEVGTAAKTDEDISLLSPPEAALLSTISHLSDLHIKIKRHTVSISDSHGSTICKAVASTIASQPLQRYMRKIVAVERSILSQDSGYVGGYGIVPLSSIVGEFAPWTRRLEWLWEVVRFMRPLPESGTVLPANESTGAATLNFLRQETHTGYADLEEMALELVTTAEMVWLRQLSTWILYGKIHEFSSEDFFIEPQLVGRESDRLSLAEFSLRTDLIPSFISPATASSILFIGNSLHQIRVRDQNLSTRSFSSDPAMILLPAHLNQLKSIALPISSSSLTSVIASIRLSTSQNALSQLLPLPKVLELVRVLQDFLLLGSGEFAMMLISNADKRIQEWHSSQSHLLPVRKAGRLDNMLIKEGDLATVLNQTWSELVALRTDGDLVDDTLEIGRKSLRIVSRKSEAIVPGGATDFSSLLFPTSTSLTLALPKQSPLNLFLTKDDLSSYCEINSYLVGIRRAEMHLASLWKHSRLRRCYPCPTGPPASSTTAGRRTWVERRKREDERSRKMRRFWAVASKSQFVISELGGYMQGEIVEGHWQHFLSWLQSLAGNGEVMPENPIISVRSYVVEEKTSRPSTAASLEKYKTTSSPLVSTGPWRPESNPKPIAKDPATLAKGHQLYLSALRCSLLLNEQAFSEDLLDFLRLLEHFVALFDRLQAAQRYIDLELDEGVVDALANHRNDEHEILQEMERSRNTIEEQLDKLVKELRDSIHQSNSEDVVDTLRHKLSDMGMGASLYIPWRPRNIDGLLMKLEFIGAKAHIEVTDDDDDDEIYYSE